MPGAEIELGRRTLLMGILNVTPDSFSDGGRFMDPREAVAQGLRMLEEGADILDVGGESSRPGADPVPEEEEKGRVLPVIERLARERRALISVDTMKKGVAEGALRAGARIINDISAMRADPEMAKFAARSKAGVVIMHMQGDPRTMQLNPSYRDVVGEISSFLAERGRVAQESGVAAEAIVYDPGIGFGKTVEHNAEIIRRLAEFKALGRPLLVGPSRKSFIGRLLGDFPADRRLEGTAAAIAVCIAGGAAIVRVHDVSAMARVARVADAFKLA